MEKKTWGYRIDLIKDQTFFGLTVAAVGISGVVVGLFLFFLTLGENFTQAVTLLVSVSLGLFALLTILTVIAYFGVFVPFHGRYYHVVFEVDDKTAKFITDKKSSKKARQLASATFLAGLATMNFTAMGMGQLAATRTTMTTSLKNVTKIKIDRDKEKFTLIESGVSRNMIYAPGEYFPWLEQHLKEHCLKANIVESKK